MNLLAEAFTALCARVGTLASVSAQVAGQVGFLAEAFIAL